MRMMAVVLLSLLTTSSVVQGQVEQSLKDALMQHIVVVRGFYTGSVLQFDTTGRLISPAVTGFGVDDASIYVTDLRLNPEKLIIEGQPTFQAYDEKLRQFQLALGADKVKVEIALPADKPASATIPELLKEVFLTEPEMQNKCSAEEEARFQQLLSSAKDKGTNKKKDEPVQAAGALSDLTTYCFPTGEKAYRVGGSVKPPKAIKLPDPEYPAAAKRADAEGTARILMIVDQEGRPTTVYLVQSAGQDLDAAAVKAVRKWKFQPSLFQGTPLPVAVNVEVHFHLH